MPRIPKRIVDCVFYLYRDRASAEKGENFGGTGFLVAELEGEWSYYGVTNWHVAVRDGFSVMRINTRDGGSDVIEFNPEDWMFIPHADDVAISPSLELSRHRVSQVSRNEFATASRLRNEEVGVGDDVFMIGRFVDHDGGPTNSPAARFGNISVMPTPVEQSTGAKRDAFLIDMHSRSGYSGSPVFVYRTPGNNLEMPQVTEMDARELERFFSEGFFMLLGIHFGQFAEEWKILERKTRSDESNSLLVHGNIVSGLSGMTCVVPADRIIELLDLPEIRMQRERRRKEFEARWSDAIPATKKR